MKFLFRYSLFAAIATALNLISQEIATTKNKAGLKTCNACRSKTCYLPKQGDCSSRFGENSGPML